MDNDRKATTRKKSEPTDRQKEIERIRKTPRDRRSEANAQRLSQLIGEEKRERFTRLLEGRMKRMRAAAKGIKALANVQSYSYTEEEANNMVGAFAALAAEIKRLYTGAPKEKGLFDL